MRRHFEEQLEELNEELIAMGALCEKSIDLATRMLLEDEMGLKRECSRPASSSPCAS